MAANALLSFNIERDGENTILRIEADEGTSWELSADPKQVERIREKIEEMLDEAVG